MKIELDRDELSKLLTIINKFAFACKNKKEYRYLKISTHAQQVAFEMGSDCGFVYLNLEGIIKEDGALCLDALDLVSVVMRLSGNKITISTVDNKVVVQDGISKIKLGLVVPESFIASIGLIDKPLGILQLNGKELNEAAKVCLPFEDELRLISGINIKLREDGALCFCCCSHAAMGMYTINATCTCDIKPFDITLSTQSFRSLCDIVKESDVEVEFFETIAKAHLPNGFITLKTLNRSYPRVEKLIPPSFARTLPIKTKELSNALDLIDIIAYDGSVTFNYASNQCILSNKAGFSTNIALDGDCGDDVTFKMERRLWRYVLRLFESRASIDLLYNEYKKPITIKHENTFIMLGVFE